MLETDPLLGAVIDNFPSDRARLLIPAVIITGIAAVALNFTVATIEAWWAPFLTVILTAGVVLAVGWRTLHLWNREIVIYQNGFSYREGSRTVFFMYPEITSIRQRGEQLAYFGGLIRRSTLRFTLATLRDETITLDRLYRRVERLGELLEAGVYPLLENMINERLRRGDRVAFASDLRLSREGLHTGDRDLPWNSFGGYRIGGGRLSLLAAPDGTEWLSLPLPEVDSAPLLVKLLRERSQ